MPFRKPGHLLTLRTECPADERRRFEAKYFAVQGLCGISMSVATAPRRLLEVLVSRTPLD